MTINNLVHPLLIAPRNRTEDDSARQWRSCVCSAGGRNLSICWCCRNVSLAPIGHGDAVPVLGMLQIVLHGNLVTG